MPQGDRFPASDAHHVPHPALAGMATGGSPLLEPAYPILGVRGVTWNLRPKGFDLGKGTRVYFCVPANCRLVIRCLSPSGSRSSERLANGLIIPSSVAAMQRPTGVRPSV